MTRRWLGLALAAGVAVACGQGPIPNDGASNDMPTRDDDSTSKKLPRSSDDGDGTTTDSDDTDPTTPEPGDDGTTPTPATDAGAGGAKDAGGGGAPNAFTGAPPFVMQTGPSTQSFVHGVNGNPAKKACLDCHGTNGPGPRWFAAGTVFQDTAAKTPAVAAEVRLRDANGNAVIAHTDGFGNFYVPYATAQAAKMSPPIQAGVRDAKTTKTMGIVDPSGSCNQSACHGGTQGFVHLQ